MLHMNILTSNLRRVRAEFEIETATPAVSTITDITPRPSVSLTLQLNMRIFSFLIAVSSAILAAHAGRTLSQDDTPDPVRALRLFPASIHHADSTNPFIYPHRELSTASPGADASIHLPQIPSASALMVSNSPPAPSATSSCPSRSPTPPRPAPAPAATSTKSSSTSILPPRAASLAQHGPAWTSPSSGQSPTRL